MAMPHNISTEGLDLIKSFEGLRLEPYMDANDGWTVGYGHLLRPGEPRRPITEQEAVDLLRVDVASAERTVRRLVLVDLDQGQFDALVSFVYNIGPGAFSRSTLLDRLNQGDYPGAAREFLRWVKDDGKLSRGLLKRRVAERTLFEKEMTNGKHPEVAGAVHPGAGDSGDQEPAGGQHQEVARRGQEDSEPVGQPGGGLFGRPAGCRVKGIAGALWGWLTRRPLRPHPVLPDQDGSGVTRLDGEEGWDDEDNRYRYPGEHPDGA